MAKIKLIVEGGKMTPGPAVAQQLGPMGINLGKVISDVNNATAGFKGMNVPIEIDVDGKTKTYKIEVFSPSVSELIKKEAGLEKGSGEAKITKVGNIAFEQVVKIAKMKSQNLLAKDLKAAVKLVVGTAQSLGVMIDNKEAKEIEKDIESGKYDSEINNEITEVSEQKKKELSAYFAKVKAQQEKTKKAIEEAKAAEEAAKAATASASSTPSSGAAPSSGTPASGKTAATAKEDSKSKKK